MSRGGSGRPAIVRYTMWPPAAEGPLRPAACRCKKVNRCPGGPGGAGSAQRLISDHHTSDLSLSGVSSTHTRARRERDASRRRLYGCCGSDRPVIVFGISRSPLPQSLVCAPVLQPWRWRSRGAPTTAPHSSQRCSSQHSGRREMERTPRTQGISNSPTAIQGVLPMCR